jgi:hypothetical protein
MQQHGAAGRDQYNIAGNFYAQASKAPTGGGGEPGDPGVSGRHSGGSGPGGARWTIGSVTAFLIFLYFLSTSTTPAADSTTAQFPSGSAAWPAQATDQLALAPVTTWLASCTDQVVLSPLHCPQAVSPGGDQVSEVRWTLHGNPGDGAVIRYSQGKFWVLGHTVMTVTYNDSGMQWQMDVFGYEATVSWNNGHPALASLPQAMSLDSGPQVVKHNPHIPLAEASALVMTAFKRCAALTVTPLPAQCMGLGSDGDHARWTLTGNPVLNAAESFDPATGLVHVTGSYAMTDSYQIPFFGTHETDYPSGSYNAVLSVDGTHATLLQIALDQ